MTKTAFLFPGQGSQAIGMAKDFYEQDSDARALVEQADSMLPGLKAIMFEGPEESLRRTLYTQPALLTAAIVALAVFKKRNAASPHFVAGHSLGEYAALVAANVLSFEDAFLLVKKRAELMDNAPAGTMAAIVGLTIDDVRPMIEQAKTNGVIVLANHNSPEQIVISGEAAAIEAACELAKEKVNPRRVIPLPVSGAFHSPLMQAANDELAQAIAAVNFKAPDMPVVTNVDGQATSEATALKEKLSRQMISAVHWVDTMQTLLDVNIGHVIELGSGKVLTGLYKKMSSEGSVVSIYDTTSLDEALNALTSVEAMV